MTNPPSQFELPVPLVYVETTVPSGMTIDEYRRSRPQRRGRRHLRQTGPRFDSDGRLLRS